MNYSKLNTVYHEALKKKREIKKKIIPEEKIKLTEILWRSN